MVRVIADVRAQSSVTNQLRPAQYLKAKVPAGSTCAGLGTDVCAGSSDVKSVLSRVHRRQYAVSLPLLPSGFRGGQCGLGGSVLRTQAHCLASRSNSAMV